jgi:hypothetical protein
MLDGPVLAKFFTRAGCTLTASAFCAMMFAERAGDWICGLPGPSLLFTSDAACGSCTSPFRCAAAFLQVLGPGCCVLNDETLFTAVSKLTECQPL